MHRNTAPKVKSGRVQKKNRWEPARSDYYAFTQPLPVVDRRRPGDSYRHLLRKQHIHDFIGLLPDWHDLSEGLDAIVLAPGESNLDGWHTTGVVAVCAWPTGLWDRSTPEFADEHRDIFVRLGVPLEHRKGEVVLKWTEGTVRAYQLLHVLLHELGHHHDRITTRSQARATRGEPFAERYARRYADLIWDRYLDAFGLD
jgi:hypothetical protein